MPFVGVAAAAFAVAEAVRLLQGGLAFSDFRLNLGNPKGTAAVELSDYDAEAATRVA